LVLFAHPYYEHSTTNVQLINCYKNNPDISFRDLYEDYPDFHIQAFRERKRLSQYQRIVFHFPLIWFGLPPLLKLWIDEVFDMKWIGQNEKNPLTGKDVMIVVSAGGSADHYSINGRYKTTIEQLLLSLRLSIEVNNMTLEDMLVVYNADHIQDSKLQKNINVLIQKLKK